MSKPFSMLFTHISIPPRRQAGAALLVALVMLLLITLIGIAASRSQTMEARMAGNLNNRNLAMQSAEAGLRTAEDGLQMAIYTAFQGNTAGQYLYTPGVTTGGAPYLTVNFSSSSAVLTGPTLSSDSSQASTFIIEQLPPVARPGDPLSTRQYSNDPHAVVYRITAKATGADNTSSITLQSIFH